MIGECKEEERALDVVLLVTAGICTEPGDVDTRGAIFPEDKKEGNRTDPSGELRDDPEVAEEFALACVLDFLGTVDEDNCFDSSADGLETKLKTGG